MTVKPFKFIVQVVALELDEDGNPTGERVSDQPAVLYGAQAVRDFVDKVEKDLADLKEQSE